MTEPIDTTEIAYKLEHEAKEIIGYLFENCFSTITAQQFKDLPEPKKLVFVNRIKNLRKLEELVTKLAHVATIEGINYKNKKETIINVLNSMLWFTINKQYLSFGLKW